MTLMRTNSSISLPPEIAIHAQHSKCVWKSGFDDATINCVPSTTKFSRLSPIDMVNTEKSKFLFSTTKTFWRSVAIMCKYTFDQLLTAEFSPFRYFKTTLFAVFQPQYHFMLPAFVAHSCYFSFIIESLCGCFFTLQTKFSTRQTSSPSCCKFRSAVITQIIISSFLTTSFIKKYFAFLIYSAIIFAKSLLTRLTAIFNRRDPAIGAQFLFPTTMPNILFSA